MARTHKREIGTDQLAGWRWRGHLAAAAAVPQWVFLHEASRGGQKYLGYFGPFWAQKVPGSTPRYLEFLLTNTSINLGVMGNSTFRIARRSTGRQ